MLLQDSPKREKHDLLHLMDEEPEAQGPDAAPSKVPQAVHGEAGFISLHQDVKGGLNPDSQRAVVGGHALQQSPWEQGLGSDACRRRR